jgi:hypothetical protein
MNEVEFLYVDFSLLLCNNGFVVSDAVHDAGRIFPNCLSYREAPVNFQAGKMGGG